jgi:hypothetical protein
MSNQLVVIIFFSVIGFLFGVLGTSEYYRYQVKEIVRKSNIVKEDEDEAEAFNFIRFCMGNLYYNHIESEDMSQEQFNEWKRK